MGAEYLLPSPGPPCPTYSCPFRWDQEGVQPGNLFRGLPPSGPPYRAGSLPGNCMRIGSLPPNFHNHSVPTLWPAGWSQPCTVPVAPLCPHLHNEPFVSKPPDGYTGTSSKLFYPQGCVIKTFGDHSLLHDMVPICGSVGAPSLDHQGGLPLPVET